MTENKAQSLREHLVYKSQAARDAQQMGYGGRNYWDYLDQSAQEMHDMFMAKGDEATAKEMFTRSLAESLRGNDGE